MTLSLQNKRALVTGGSRGTGAGIVKRLAREGAEVARPTSANPRCACLIPLSRLLVEDHVSQPQPGPDELLVRVWAGR